jgi:DNA sulfur modification protein DndE
VQASTLVAILKTKLLMKNLVLLFSLFISNGFKIIEPKVTIFLIGDSTMANKRPEDSPETGWGQVFSQYFDHSIEIQNHAVNGRSTKSFRALGHWDKVLPQLKKGDWVLIQFGHNDSKKDDTTRFADAQTDYRQNLARYIQEIRSKGANPVLITPVARRKFDESGSFIDQHGEYPTVVKEVAKQLKTPLIDLHQKSQKIIEQHGIGGSKSIFMHFEGGIYPKFKDRKEDNTHFSPYGASLIASVVADEIKKLPLDWAKSLLPLSVSSQTTYLYELPKIIEPVFKKDTFNILQFNAKADGIFLNTNAVQNTINACAKKGGGTVLITKGLWLTGALALKSNVNLHLQKGAILQFSSNYDDYPLVQTNWEGLDAIRCHSPIYGADLENVAITGQGTIDGAGDAWRAVKKSKLYETAWKKLITSGGMLNEKQDTWYPTEKSFKGSKATRPGVIAEGYNLENAKEIKEFLRPNMLNLTGCKKILLEGVTFQNSPAWCLHPLLSEHITLRNLTVRNPWYAQNGDGVDLESCKNFLVEDCIFDVGDDGICIKSGRDAEGRKRGVPTENGIVRNCTVFHAHGGFVIGSEMSGGVKNLYVSDCNFMGTDIGLRFKTARGRGGLVEKIYINHINMTDIVGEAILFDMYYMAKDPIPLEGDNLTPPSMESEPVSEATPQFRDFEIRNVTVKGAEKAIFIRGLPEMNIKNILIENSIFQSKKGFVCQEADNITLRNTTLLPKENTVMQIQDSKNINLENIKSPLNPEGETKIKLPSVIQWWKLE